MATILKDVKATKEAVQGTVEEVLGGATKKEAPKTVSKAISRTQALDLAQQVKDAYDKTENVSLIADALEKMVQEDPDVFKAVKGNLKNPKRQLEALGDIPTFKNYLGKYLAQTPRRERANAPIIAAQQEAKKADEDAVSAALEKNKPVPFGGPAQVISRDYAFQGTGLGNLVQKPDDDVIPSGAGGFGGVIDFPEKPTANVPSPAPKDRRSLAAAIGAGTAALGGAGAVAGLTGGEKPTPTLTPEYAPVARPDGTIGMSDAEFKAIEKEKGTVVALREQKKKYEDLNDRFLSQQKETYKSSRMTPPDLSTPSGQRASQAGAQRFLADLRAEQAAPTSQAETPASEPTPGPTEEKELTAKPAPSSGGKGTPETTQPAAVPTQEPTPQVTASQATLPDDIVGLYRLSERMAGGGKTVSRKSIIDALENLKRLEDDIAVLYDKDPPPELKDISTARREAYQAYKETANQNRWLGIIDKAIGALGQFASAKSALGTAYIGNYRPSTPNYQEDTQQALREFQTEVSLLEKEREESREARQQAIKEKETIADRLTRQRQIELKQAEEEVRTQQDAVDRADSLTKTFFNANVDFERQKMQTAAAEKKQAAATIEDQKKATSDILKLQIDEVQDNIKQAQRLKEAAAAVAADPSDANVAKLAAVYPGDLQQAIKDDPAWFDTKAAKAVAKELVASNTDLLNKLQSDLQSARQAQKQNIAGQLSPAPRQQAPQGGKVNRGNIKYRAGDTVQQGNIKVRILKDFYENDDKSTIEYEEIK